MLKRITDAIPNTITCLNLISGCVAIFMAFHLHETIGGLTGGTWAIIAIAMAALFDFLDGAAARLFKAVSAIGKDLDSLSDLVSFGVAPAMLMLNTMTANGSSLWAAAPCLLIPAFGAIRLAIFNNDTQQSTTFRGLPIPANAIFWIGMYGWIGRYFYPGAGVIWVLIALLCWAMVGKFKMFSLKFKNLDFYENFCRYVIIVAAIIFVAMYGLAGLAWTILLYFLLSYLRQNRI
ncbi:MAG: CDP-alcohol phosphatidyltransferase family protein [Muribaculaceae bacterium]|nr:CDP-alcohol phosphatidyltransferase family protein [Muribaculaceae bacterium]